MSDVTLGFNDLSAGTIVNGQYSAKGVTVSSANASTPIMIFDTNNVTGGDHDLATHNLDNVLILSEDGDQNDPDDNAHGGTFRFDFDGTTTVKELTFLDIEEGAKVRFFDGDGNFMGVCKIPATYDNGQLVACFDVANVGSMEVVLPGSGAIDNLVFEEITPTNDAPDAIDDMAEMDEDTSIVLSVLDNDTDPDGDPLTIISAVSPQGEVVINDDGTLTFTPNENFNGMTTVDYVVSDGNGGTDKAWVKVTVHAVNDAPDAVDDHDTTEEDTSIVIDLLDNDTDVDGDPLMVTFVSVPAEQGTVVNNGDGTATFTPAADFTGTAMISYDIKDGQGGRDWAKHFVEVTPTNDAPDAVDDMAEMDEDTSIVLSVLDNDTDPDGDPLTIISAVSPQGEVVINDDGTLTFTPNENFNGMTTVDYVVSDGNGGTDKAWVKVTVHAVNDAPDAVDDHDTTEEDTSIVIDLLDNDTDVDGDPLMVTFVSVPAEQGTVVNNGDGTATFTPAADFTGTAMISYDIKDGQGGRDWAKHFVEVTPTNDAPDAVDDMAEMDEDTSIVLSVLDNDTDPDGDPLTIISAVSPQGEVVINDDGTLTFTPNENFNGMTTVDYVVSDGNGGTDKAWVKVTVHAVNDAPDAVDDHDTTEEDTSIVIDLLDNDTDVDGDPLMVTFVSVPAEQGTVVNNGDGTATFTPAADFTGTAMISYDIKDGQGGRDWAKHFVEVTPTNDAPDAVDDPETTDQDTSIVIDNVLGNDSDPDGDALSVSEVDGANGNVGQPVAGDNGGLITINTDGSASFDPNGDFDYLAVGETAETSITYQISDGNGGFDTAAVVVTIDGKNDGPDAVDATDTTEEDTAITVDLLANDTDADGDALSVTNATVPADQGTLVDNGDGTVTFTPAPNFNGTATISYEIADGNGGTDAAQHFIDVTPTNDGPDAVNDVAEADEDTPVTISVLDNDSDPEGDPLTITEATSPDGDVVINDDGKLTFLPNTDFNGEATIEYVITDGNGGTDTATVTVTVNSVEDAPEALNNVYQVRSDEAFGDVDGNVIADDTGDGIDRDADGDILTVMAVAGVAANVGTAVAGDNGGLFIINADGTVDFNANGEFDDLGLNDQAETSVTYTITDGNGGTDTATATFIVTGINNGTVEGTDGADVITPGFVDADGDIVDGNDAILPGDVGDDDLIYGYGGDDTIDAGNGDDEVYGGEGNDDITGGDGNDTVYGEAGDDVIDTSNPNDDALPDVGYPGLYPADTDPNDDKDVVFGGAGNDTITTGDDDDIIEGGTGNDTIDAGWDDDTVRGGEGNDTIIGNEGNDLIFGNDGNDVIYGGLDLDAPDAINLPDDGSGPFGPDLVPENNGDTIFGGAGDDTIYGQDDDDTLYGGAGDDVLDGGVDDDFIAGGDGDDQIIGGQGADALSGGQGSDTFVGGNGGDAIVGGEDADDSDIDVLDLSGEDVDNIAYNEDDAESGIVTFGDGTTLTFSEIENVIPCFTPGTRIATARGERLVEELKVGDKIITRDNGIQEIAWVGHKQLSGRELARSEHLKPILVRTGSLGNGLPERDMMVSPNHRMLVANDLTQLYFEEREVLAAAKHMVGVDGIQRIDVTQTTYIHFMFERHEVVLSDGAWTESFQPGDYTLKGIGNSQRNEIIELFPELGEQAGLDDYQSARRSLKKHEAKLLVH